MLLNITYLTVCIHRGLWAECKEKDEMLDGKTASDIVCIYIYIYIYIYVLQRWARELISGHDLATRAGLLSFNRTQSMVVIGLLTGHNTLRRHLYIMQLSNTSTCRKCGSKEETSVHVLC